jgi:flagellin
VTSGARAILRLGGTSGETVVRITGPRGTADITVVNGSSADMVEAVNVVAGITGVYASQLAGGTAVALSEEYGSHQAISIEVISGEAMLGRELNAPTYREAGERESDAGADPLLSLFGTRYQGEGRHFKIVNNFLNVEFSLQPVYDDPEDQLYILPGSISFRVMPSGMNFQLNETAYSTDHLPVGIEPIMPDFLGMEEIRDVIRSAESESTQTMGGTLRSLISGAENDLNSENVANALTIVDRSIKQVARLRAFLGAVQTDNVEPNIRALEVAVENLTATESQIRDLDFAEETSNFTRTQILFQAGTAVLASANLIPQTVLMLLQG